MIAVNLGLFKYLGEIDVYFEEYCKWADPTGFTIQGIAVEQLIIDNLICAAYG